MSFFSTVIRVPLLRKPLYNWLYKRIAKKQYKLNNLVCNSLNKLKDYHYEETCFIIGTGPSLKVEDLMKIKEKGIITFAPNRIFEITEKNDWQPTYYICQDHHIIKTFGERIATTPSTMSFLPIEYKDVFKDPKFNFFVLRERDYYPEMPKFSNDVSKYIDQGYTVTFGAIQMAAFMGFKRIYLLGVDHNYSVYRDSKGRPIRQNNQKSDYPEVMSNYMNDKTFPRIEESTIAYDKAEKESRKLGFRIFNATRGGKLEAFERVDFDELMERWEMN